MEKKIEKKGKIFTGKVVSVAMQKTVIVEIIYTKMHALYKKAIKRSRRFPAHNEQTDIAVGDRVEIKEIKPISRTKHFIVTRKI